jgi:hypothetical protein
MPQSNALAQRGQRALLPEWGMDSFMMGPVISLQPDSRNDATTDKPR